MTPKEQTTMARCLTYRVKTANTPLEIKKLIYTGFIDGLEQTEGYADRNIMGFCTILDRLVTSRRKK